MDQAVAHAIKCIGMNGREGVAALATCLARSDLDRFHLDAISHAVLKASLRQPAVMASALEQAANRYRGAPTALLDRTIGHAIDAIWRADTDKQARRQNVKRMLAHYGGRHGDIPSVLLFRGAMEMQGGRRDAAFRDFWQAADKAGDLGLPRLYTGAFSVRIGNWLGGHEVAGTSPLTWLRHPLDRGPATILLASDGPYFLKFAAALHSSIREHDRLSNVHYHVVNWLRDCSSLAAAIVDSRTSISAEVYPHRKDFTYFATVRFYRSIEIMQVLDQHLYITDIDNKFTGALHGILPRLMEQEAGFRVHGMGDWFPWWAPSGGNLWLRNDAGGRSVAEWLRRYVAARFVPNSRFSWWFDQLALNEVHHHAQGAGVSVISLADPTLSVSVARPYGEIAHLKSKS